MLMIPENDPKLKSFIDVDANSDFPIQNLPFGVFHLKNDNTPRIGVAIGNMVLDLREIENAGLFNGPLLNKTQVFNQPTLNKFMAMGRLASREARSTISKLLRHDESTLRDNQNLRQSALHLQKDIVMLLPIQVGGYTDFYSSKEHATNVGVLFRDKENPLLPNWLHIPVGYDGRASSVVVSGTDFHRPMGQIRPGNEGNPSYSESKQLDTEVELAFIVGTTNKFGEAIPVNNAPEYVFGAVLLSDWSARDIQRWEYVPLGPFLGKNFCTSISAWVVTLDALEPFRQQGCEQVPAPLDYLKSTRDYSYNINLELTIKTQKMSTPMTISRTNYLGIYWDFCQQLAHHTMGGCKMQTGDIFASGTISGSDKDSYGSMLELTWAGATPIKLPSGEERTFICDGDSVAINGWCENNDYRIGFGSVVATILSAIK